MNAATARRHVMALMDTKFARKSRGAGNGAQKHHVHLIKNVLMEVEAALSKKDASITIQIVEHMKNARTMHARRCHALQIIADGLQQDL
jgi:hypothetical protein